ncbi:MAG: tyrosine-type recombinase/integrase [bacterium]|nr:tyrosine-type recombinase/integrase [bacterium]
MNDEPKVWIRSRNCKTGKTTYHLRWICPQTHKWRNRKVGGDRRRAEREAAQLEHQLSAGTYHDVRRKDWTEFVAEHVSKIPGTWNRTMAERTLTEFGEAMDPRGPHRVTFAMLEDYAEKMATKGNAPATVNKKMRYLRAAFRKAVRRGYMASNPMEGWQWARVNRKRLRIATDQDETALLDSAEELCGFQARAFIHTALNTGGRHGELVSLAWDNIDLSDDPSVTFTETKGKRDRLVPIEPADAAVLLKLKAQTLRDGGPFVTLRTKLPHVWPDIVKAAGVKPITIHDLRRTYITRLIRGGASLPTVQQLAGHATVTTTVEFYNEVNNTDLREAVAKKRRTSAS